jgi:1-acyl-sn-glycerol-3-phosphate acyltransferase
VHKSERDRGLTMNRSISFPSGAAWFRGAYERLAFALALAVFGAAGLTFTLVGSLLRWILPRRAGAALGQWAISALFRFFVGLLHRLGLARCDLAALDALRDGPPLVIAPNHPTLLDVILIVSRLPKVTCIMKAAVLENVFLFGGARLAGYIRADPPKAMIRAAGGALADGRHVLVFPEGTRTVGTPVNRFTGGFAAISGLAGAPVQTVFIEARSPYLSKGWPLLRRPEFPLEYRVRLGERFAPQSDSKALFAEIEAYFRRELGPDAARV